MDVIIIISHFTVEEELLFCRRVEEGYELPDSQYEDWKVYNCQDSLCGSPDVLHSSSSSSQAESHVCSPQPPYEVHSSQLPSDVRLSQPPSEVACKAKTGPAQTRKRSIKSTVLSEGSNS